MKTQILNPTQANMTVKKCSLICHILTELEALAQLKFFGAANLLKNSVGGMTGLKMKGNADGAIIFCPNLMRAFTISDKTKPE
jgi:hypothetical protein